MYTEMYRMQVFVSPDKTVFFISFEEPKRNPLFLFEPVFLGLTHQPTIHTNYRIVSQKRNPRSLLF